MKCKRTFGLFLVAAMMALGCATGPSISERKTPLPALEQGKGRVFFYRSGIIGGAYQPDVTLNWNVVGKATPRGVYFRDVSPGSYTITTSMTKQEISFVLGTGQTRYVRLSYSFGFKIYPELIEASVGEREIQDLRYIDRP